LPSPELNGSFTGVVFLFPKQINIAPPNAGYLLTLLTNPLSAPGKNEKKIKKSASKNKGKKQNKSPQVGAVEFSVVPCWFYGNNLED